MGEAKHRQKLRDQVLGRFPNCIYCGGKSVASTIDHVPPRAVFHSRHRPRGLEFPACNECNKGARIDELAVAMLSRLYPDSENELEREEITNLMRSVNNNLSGLLEEMQPSYRQKKLGRQYGYVAPGSGGVLNCKGPILNRAINRFAAKMGYALHFEIGGKPVPIDGGASVWWLTNYQAFKSDMPHQLINMLGERKTLRQGSWDVEDQFSYASLMTVERTMSAHFATFRASFAICAVVAENIENIRPPNDVDHVTLHTPGWLQATA